PTRRRPRALSWKTPNFPPETSSTRRSPSPRISASTRTTSAPSKSWSEGRHREPTLKRDETAPMGGMTPQEIVHELDKYIVGQGRAKRSVAIALRNRWRRLQVAEPLRQEITPKNILMIGA